MSRGSPTSNSLLSSPHLAVPLSGLCSHTYPSSLFPKAFPDCCLSLPTATPPRTELTGSGIQDLDLNSMTLSLYLEASFTGAPWEVLLQLSLGGREGGGGRRREGERLRPEQDGVDSNPNPAPWKFLRKERLLPGPGGPYLSSAIIMRIDCCG